jgi:hypothetical protein
LDFLDSILLYLIFLVQCFDCLVFCSYMFFVMLR